MQQSLLQIPTNLAPQAVVVGAGAHANYEIASVAGRSLRPMRAGPREGPAAGPIGAIDIRSALLPPPGLYGGAFALAAEAYNFVDGKGNTIPALETMHLFKEVGAPFLFYVPKGKVLGGSVGIGALVPFGNSCGHLFIGENNECMVTLGDPYVEFDWSRSWAKPRPSKVRGAYPIM